MRRLVEAVGVALGGRHVAVVFPEGLRVLGVEVEPRCDAAPDLCSVSRIEICVLEAHRHRFQERRFGRAVPDEPAANVRLDLLALLRLRV